MPPTFRADITVATDDIISSIDEETTVTARAEIDPDDQDAGGKKYYRRPQGCSASQGLAGSAGRTPSRCPRPELGEIRQSRESSRSESSSGFEDLSKSAKFARGARAIGWRLLGQPVPEESSRITDEFAGRSTLVRLEMVLVRLAEHGWSERSPWLVAHRHISEIR